MLKAGRNLRPVWSKLKPVMIKDQKEHFRLRLGPDGIWPPRAETTGKRQLRSSRRRAIKKGRKPPKNASRRVLGGKMATAFGVAFNRDALAAKSKIPWSGSHQEGDQIGRGRWDLPKRTHLYLSDKFLALVEERIEQHLLKGWLKR